MGIWIALTAAQGFSGPLFERMTVSSQAQYRTSYLPCLARLSDDRLFCVFTAIDPEATGVLPRTRAGIARLSMGAVTLVVVGRFSDDCGKTWSTPVTLINSKPELDYDANIIVIGSRVIVTSTTVPSTHGQFISTSRTVAVRSEDFPRPRAGIARLGTGAVTFVVGAVRDTHGASVRLRQDQPGHCLAGWNRALRLLVGRGAREDRQA